MQYAIRTKIGIALLGLVILATGVMGTAGYFMLEAYLWTSQGETMVLLARLQAERIQERLNNEESRLLAMAREIQELRQNGYASSLQRSLQHDMDEFSWLALVKPDGRLEFMVGQSESRPDFSQLPAFRQAISHPGEVVVTPLTRLADGQPGLYLSFTDNRIFGEQNEVLIGAVSLAAILPAVQATLMGRNGFVLVIDTEARVLSHFDPTRLSAMMPPVKSSGYKEVVSSAVAMKTGFGRALWKDGDFFVAYAPVEARRWSVLVLLPYHASMAPVRELAWWFFGLFVVVVLLAGVLSWFIAGGVTTSISRLTSAIKLFANGRMSVRVDVTSQDEVGQLAESFNKMAQDLEYSDQQLRQEVETRVRAETEQRLATREAERANQAKSEFLATMSHEIRTPMNAILGMAELLGSNELEPEQRQEYIRTLQRNGEALLILINDILDVSKMEAGLIQLEKTPFNLEELQTGVMSLFKLMASEHGLLLSGRIDPGVSLVRLGDVQRLRQILINLVGNAIKFTTKGSVTCRVGLLDEARLVQETLLFEVTDTGMGIAEEQSSLIFEKFIQADGSSTRSFGGTGLGLALCKSLVELMGGRIWVESQPGQGSRFSFTVSLPVVADGRMGTSVSPVGAVVKRTVATLAGLQVLLVEDSQDNILLIKAFLKKTGILLTLAEHGEEGVRKFQAGQFDLVLMDMQMPIMDGYMATRTIRAWEVGQGLRRTPILALTAYALTGDVEKSLLAGCDAHLSKPIHRAALLEAIGQYVVTLEERRHPVEVATPEPDGLDLVGVSAGSTWLEATEDVNGSQEPFQF